MAPENTDRTKPADLAKGDDAAPGGFLNEYPRSGAVILFVNAAGFVSYVCWLIHVRQRIFYTQDGVFYLLPILLFLFVFVFILSKPQKTEESNAPDHAVAGAPAQTETKKG